MQKSNIAKLLQDQEKNEIIHQELSRQLLFVNGIKCKILKISYNGLYVVITRLILSGKDTIFSESHGEEKKDLFFKKKVFLLPERLFLNK